jgi:glycerol-1-phosphate dehydrogenase [NAD(P)+]
MPAGDPAGDPIALLLDGRYPDPDAPGTLLRAESRSVVIEDSLAGAEAELVAALGVGPHLAVLSDAHTHAALGARVERALAGRFTVQSLVLGDAPHADADTVARILAALDPRTDAVIAVGSGTLNDLAKMVAMQRDCPQLVFATAPSMNGYTSLSASITSDGIKRSVRTRTPLGDSACRPTAQADWLLSHLLLDRPYRRAPFALLAADEVALFGQTAGLVRGDLAAMRHLARTLALSGFGMTICNGSYPASQGEHLLSHYVEMMRPAGVPPAFHGEQIGVCTVAMARLHDRMLAADAAPVLRPNPLVRADVVAHFGTLIGDACWREIGLKHFDAAATEQLNARLAERWDAIRSQIHAVTLGPTRMRDTLAAAGAPVEPEHLGWPPPLFASALRHAREIRNRYTFLDLAADAA